jgi:hypothetical protein
MGKEEWAVKDLITSYNVFMAMFNTNFYIGSRSPILGTI